MLHLPGYLGSTSMRVKVKFKDLPERKKNKIIKRIQKKLPRKIEDIILERIAKGISPVANQGRFKKYSPSYIDQIKNRAAYRYIGGKAVRFTADAPWGITDAEFKAMRPSAAARRSRREAKANLKQKITDMNSDITKYGKRVRPVNLYLSGEMIKSFFIKSSDRGFRLGFTDKKAWYHNDTGPGGKREYKRRLLPTIPGENFTRAIIKDIIKEIKKII